MAESSPKSYYHSLVPYAHRVMALLGFCRTHTSDSIIVPCIGDNTAEYFGILFNLYEIKTSFVTRKQSAASRQSAISRFNTGAVNVIFLSLEALNEATLAHATYAIQIDIPKAVEEQITLVSQLPVDKFVLFIDPSESAYIELLKSAGVESKELAFNPIKIPKVHDKAFDWNKKNYQLYTCSQYGYRELISQYRNHTLNTIFNATKLPLVSVASIYAIRAPPKLPLTP